MQSDGGEVSTVDARGRQEVSREEMWSTKGWAGGWMEVTKGEVWVWVVSVSVSV